MAYNDSIQSWKVFSKTKYLEVNQELLMAFKVDANQLQKIATYFNQEYFPFPLECYMFSITKDSKRLIDLLIKFYKLKIDNVSLYALASLLQKDYLLHYEDPVNINSGEFGDLEMYHQDLNNLFDLIKIKLHNESLADFKNFKVTFKDERVFTNIFIFKDIFESLISFYKIDLNNFEEIRARKLEEFSNIKLDKILEHQKFQYIKGLYKIINPDNISKKPTKKDLRFICAYFLASQIPISSLANEIILPHTIIPSEFLDSDLSNLRKKLQGDTKLYHKTETKNT